MKLIVAIIRPFKLDEVREALKVRGLNHLTSTEGKGAGRYTNTVEPYRGAEYHIDFLPYVRIELVVEDKEVEAAMETISMFASTHNEHGDGCMYVIQTERFRKINQK